MLLQNKWMNQAKKIKSFKRKKYVRSFWMEGIVSNRSAEV